MKVCQINPVVYSARNFNFLASKNDYKKINSLKTQYVYRFLTVKSGKVNVEINGREYNCSRGDVIYLIPGDFYRLKPCGCDFSFYNVFFDYFERDDSAPRVYACVYDDTFVLEKCSKRVEFEDGVVLNESKVFHAIESFNGYENTVQNRLDSGVWELSLKISVMQTICKILSINIRESKQKNDKVFEILRYIDDNATENLSATSLGNRFGYHRNYINQMIKERTGNSLSKQVRIAKIKHAKRLMTEMGYTPTETAWTLGYYDYSHFYKNFKKETGLLPTEYIIGKNFENL